MGGDGAWNHINSCIHHASNWTGAHEHILRALERICNDAGFATNHKRVLTSEGSRRADLEIRNICVAEKIDLLVDVTLRHDFVGAGRSGLTQGQLRNPDNLDHIFESAAADKIRNYRDPYQRNRQVAFLPACMSTSGRIHGELLCLIFFLSNKQADDYFAALVIRRTKRSFFCGLWLSGAQRGVLRLEKRMIRWGRWEMGREGRPFSRWSMNVFRCKTGSCDGWWRTFALEYRQPGPFGPRF